MIPIPNSSSIRSLIPVVWSLPVISYSNSFPSYPIFLATTLDAQNIHSPIDWSSSSSLSCQQRAPAGHLQAAAVRRRPRTIHSASERESSSAVFENCSLNTRDTTTFLTPHRSDSLLIINRPLSMDDSVSALLSPFSIHEYPECTECLKKMLHLQDGLYLSSC